MTDRRTALLPSQAIEYHLLQLALRDDGAWRPVQIGQLATEVDAGLPAVLAALQRLHKAGHVELRKWSDGRFIAYNARQAPDFFYTANFEIRITPDGRPYAEELHAKVRAMPTTTSPIRTENHAMDWTLLHPAITQIARKRLIDGHHADAVEASLKEVNQRLKVFVHAQSGEELDGADLMYRAFAPKKPIVVLGDLATESGRSIQQGYMQLFAGAMIGIRNPKAHANLIIGEVRALHFLVLASLLMTKLDEGGVPPAT